MHRGERTMSHEKQDNSSSKKQKEKVTVKDWKRKENVKEGDTVLYS